VAEFAAAGRVPREEAIAMYTRFVVAAVLLWPAAAPLSAAEIKVLAGSAVQPVMNDIIPAFEQKSGHRVMFAWGATGEMARRVQGGEQADLAIVSGPQAQALLDAGKLVPGTRLDLGRTGVGVFVKKGAPRPDIGSVESFKQAMLAAKNIGYNDPAAGAPVSIYLIGLFDKLGISSQMTPKTVVFKQRSERFGAVTRGDVEIGFNQVSEIIAVPTVDLVGPLPEAIQNYTTLSIAAVSNTAQAEAGKALLQYLAAPDIISTFRSRGFSAP
jgi:molybdate transport system substrate-binding protein